MKNGIGTALENRIIQTDAVTAVDADMPGRRLFTIIKDLRMQAGHELAGAQINMYIGECTGSNGDGTGLLGRSLLTIRFATDIDMQRFDIVSPVAAGDLGICLDTLLVLGLGVGMVARDAQFFARGVEIRNDEVDNILVCGLIMFTCRVLGFVGGLVLDCSS